MEEESRHDLMANWKYVADPLSFAGLNIIECKILNKYRDREVIGFLIQR